MAWFDPTVRVTGTDLVGRFAVRIAENCDAVEVNILFTVAVLAFPRPGRKRVVAWLGGLCAARAREPTSDLPRSTSWGCTRHCLRNGTHRGGIAKETHTLGTQPPGQLSVASFKRPRTSIPAILRASSPSSPDLIKNNLGSPDLLETLPPAERYSATCSGGNSQVLDHLWSPRAARGSALVGFDVVHANAEFSTRERLRSARSRASTSPLPRPCRRAGATGTWRCSPSHFLEWRFRFSLEEPGVRPREPRRCGPWRKQSSAVESKGRDCVRREHDRCVLRCGARQPGCGASFSSGDARHAALFALALIGLS